MNSFKSIFNKILSEDANTAAGSFGSAAAAAASDSAMQGPQIYGNPADARPFSPARMALGAKIKKGKKKKSLKKGEDYDFPIARRQSIKM
jgi:hypothetical protein